MCVEVLLRFGNHLQAIVFAGSQSLGATCRCDMLVHVDNASSGSAAFRWSHVYRALLLLVFVAATISMFGVYFLPKCKVDAPHCCNTHVFSRIDR